MTISFVAAIDGTSSAQGLAITLPAEILAGDTLIAGIGSNSISGYSHVTPPGWSLLATSYGSLDGGSQFASLYTKEAASSDASAAMTFGVTPSGAKNVGVVGVYRGTITPPIVAAVAVLPHAGTATQTIAVPQVNVPELPAWLVTLASKKGGTGDPIPLTEPTDFTQRVDGWVDGGGRMTIALADDEAAATGTTAVGTWNSTVSSSAGTGFLLALTEGAPPALGAPTFHRWTIDGWVPPLP